MNRLARFSARWVGLGLVLGAAAPARAQADKDRPQPPIEVYEWSVWVGNPAQTTLNAPRAYRNALPAAVGTSRPKAEGAELERKFAVAPVSVLQAFGDPTEDIDIDLRVKKGTILAHWPAGAERSGGLRWFKSSFLKAPPAGVAPGNFAADHWLGKLRRVDSALYLRNETRVERFLAYDAELAVPLPVKIRGGPDEYTLQNLTPQRLVDVAVIAPAEGGGYRVGWLDALPSAAPKETVAEGEAKAKAKAEEKKAAERPEGQAKAAEAIFEAADAEAKEKGKPPKAEPKPIPPEADANLRARVDQALNRSVTVNVVGAPRKDVLALVAGQARLRYEVDEPTLAKDAIDLAQPMTLKGGSLAARDALADVLGSVGLSYRIADDGGLFVTTAARLAAEAGKKTVVEGPPIKLTLGLPLKPTDPSFREVTRDAYTRRLAAQGMRAEAIGTFLDEYGRVLFEPRELIVVAHLTRDAIDEVVLLDVFPNPKKFVRVAAVVAAGVDPRLQDRARGLVRQLGDLAPRAREAAEAQLYELGPVAVPVLEDALREQDIEVVFRAERLLMRLNRPVP